MALQPKCALHSMRILRRTVQALIVGGDVSNHIAVWPLTTTDSDGCISHPLFPTSMASLSVMSNVTIQFGGWFYWALDRWIDIPIRRLNLRSTGKLANHLSLLRSQHQ